MKKVIYLIAIFSPFLFGSCNDDFLERAPLDEISEPEFWLTTGDLELYATAFYQDLPGWQGVSVGSSPSPDNGTDLSMGTTGGGRLYGTGSIPTVATTALWGWTKVRKANYFISNVSKVTGTQTDINQYTGEAYFFRAYYYFDLLQKYGDLPIYKEYFGSLDTDELYKARDPRNEVADFILADLDLAISLLKAKSALTTPRINKEAAQLLKATVALYEGTWEKYHAGTAFGVTGSTGTTYLQQAADASSALIAGNTRSLSASYGDLFNQTTLATNTEIILWRQYDFLGLGSSFGNALQLSWPNASSYTRFAMRSYLCTDGQPISTSPLYQGDLSLTKIETNRDPRLAATVMVPGDIVTIAANGTITYFVKPTITGTYASVGGYESQKYRRPQVDVTTGSQSRDVSKIIMRYAEALLIYAEAKAELGTITQSDLDISINKLRARVGMPSMNLASITNDVNWPQYGYTLTPILQEIRRERTVELMNEGFRLDDLMRWAAHSLLIGQNVKGAYYETGWTTGQNKDTDNYLDPYQKSYPGGFDFNPDRDYLLAIPSTELILNTNLTQNPGW
ncbi:RagB/SusD family nutrient uptake outer membrane protein [Flavobacterium algicola]|uniref:RagB/SusD family nutrient uptake outer membrane protein n=1 Tax=Flavobacterium algicola TaxID=556529 RepID=UPI001EFE3B23|nr:RagB/SusD family nutrient uptake outer membrane protein [Flavobacterium algicola]MCG9793120.1 RagB/SusD family nutrient uptake outer membrane protein [Flavobacterium algicola]